MTRDRCLKWDGCTSVRDLGGLNTIDGQVTRWAAVVRSDHPVKLTEVGWSALYKHGIHTIVRLASDGSPEDVLDTVPYPSDVVTIRCAVEDLADTEFVKLWVTTGLWSTPLYYRDALKRWPERHVAVIQAIARARPGGVMIHCHRGNDRTGIVTLLLLALVGVVPTEILADYELSLDTERDRLLAREHTTIRETILTTTRFQNPSGAIRWPTHPRQWQCSTSVVHTRRLTSPRGLPA